MHTLYIGNFDIKNSTSCTPIARKNSNTMLCLSHSLEWHLCYMFASNKTLFVVRCSFNRGINVIFVGGNDSLNICIEMALCRPPSVRSTLIISHSIENSIYLFIGWTMWEKERWMSHAINSYSIWIEFECQFLLSLNVVWLIDEINTSQGNRVFLTNENKIT